MVGSGDPGPSRMLRTRPQAMRAANGGFGLIEILLVLAIGSVLVTVLYGTYFGSTKRAIEQFQSERPLAKSRLAADRATVSALRSALQIYRARNGEWPTSRDVVAGLVNPPAQLQCEGNELVYDPATGQLSLLIDDPARC